LFLHFLDDLFECFANTGLNQHSITNVANVMIALRAIGALADPTGVEHDNHLAMRASDCWGLKHSSAESEWQLWRQRLPYFVADAGAFPVVNHEVALMGSL